MTIKALVKEVESIDDEILAITFSNYILDGEITDEEKDAKLPNKVQAFYAYKPELIALEGTQVENPPYPSKGDISGTDYNTSVIHFGKKEDIEKHLEKQIFDIKKNYTRNLLDQIEYFASGEELNLFDCVMFVQWDFPEDYAMSVITVDCFYSDIPEDVILGSDIGKFAYFLCGGAYDDSDIYQDITPWLLKICKGIKVPQLPSDFVEEEMGMDLEEIFEYDSLLDMERHIKKNNLLDLYLRFICVYMDNFNYVDGEHDVFNRHLFNTYCKIKEIEKNSNLIESFELKFDFGNSNKFYKAKLNEHEVIYEYGRIGSDKVKQDVKSYSSKEVAHKEMIKKLISQIKSGYYFNS